MIMLKDSIAEEILTFLDKCEGTLSNGSLPERILYKLYTSLLTHHLESNSISPILESGLRMYMYIYKAVYKLGTNACRAVDIITIH